jgi:NOL1/NOP2/sun family putative RNA methylase
MSEDAGAADRDAPDDDRDRPPALDVLDRYRPLVEDFEAFRAACVRPLGYVVRVNPLKATVDRVRRAYDEAGVAHEPVDWHERLLRLDSDSPGASWPYVHGWVYPQEEVSVLPALALDPQPGESVFDTCAAPGSKTTQIAAAMADRGTLVANDQNLGRLAPLRSNAQRLGVTNTVVTHGDARNFSMNPLAVDEFDRTLVDAPCTCEGTIRKNPDALAEWSETYLHSVADLQRSILGRAIEVTRPGGRVVYATCTFAPEENEAVLDHALAEHDCRVVDVRGDLPLETAPGVREWDGQEFDPQVQRAARVYPHHNDTGGFFCARLEVGG